MGCEWLDAAAVTRARTNASIGLEKRGRYLADKRQL